MKLTTTFNLLTLSLALVIGGTACKKNPKDATPIPGMRPNVTGGGNQSGILDNGGIIPPSINVDPTTGGIEAADHSAIEGHCDERGTEGYNLSLGDKRANSLREYLVNLGVSPERIHTVSFGEAQPADNGHNESAWAKNRRGEFIFIEPAK